MVVNYEGCAEYFVAASVVAHGLPGLRREPLGAQYPKRYQDELGTRQARLSGVYLPPIYA